MKSVLSRDILHKSTHSPTPRHRRSNVEREKRASKIIKECSTIINHRRRDCRSANKSKEGTESK